MYNVSVSPHIRDKSSTQKIMIDVCIALIPTLAFGVWHFGANALIVIISSVVSCVLSELIFELIYKKPITVFDFSAVVTGLIIALNMPPQIAWWVPAIGGVFAIVIVKMLFGGIGQNIMNPALAARCFLLISFTSRMTDFSTVDGVSSATELAQIKAGNTINLRDAFLGLQSGCIGEVCTLAILIGFAYLLIRKVISPRIPLIYMASTVVFVVLFALVKGREMDFSGMVKPSYRRFNERCGIYGNRLHNKPDYKNGSGYLCNINWIFNCNIQSPRLKCRRCILCYYYFKPCCSSY